MLRKTVAPETVAELSGELTKYPYGFSTSRKTVV